MPQTNSPEPDADRSRLCSTPPVGHRPAKRRTILSGAAPVASTQLLLFGQAKLPDIAAEIDVFTGTRQEFDVALGQLLGGSRLDGPGMRFGLGVEVRTSEIWCTSH